MEGVRGVCVTHTSRRGLEISHLTAILKRKRQLIRLEERGELFRQRFFAQMVRVVKTKQNKFFRALLSGHNVFLHQHCIVC